MAIGSSSRFSPSPGFATFSAPTADASRSVFDELGIVVGLAAEARIARRLGVRVEVGGSTAEGAAAAASRLIAAGARSLLSFGVAGGLDPRLEPGALIVPDVVMTADGHYPTDPPLSAALGRVGGAAFGAMAIVPTREAKRALFQRTGAACVDLESGAVAHAAARHALPFAVLRAVCDPAERSLPPIAALTLDSRGRIAPWRVLRAILPHPGTLRPLLRLASDAAAARKALSKRVALLQRLRTESGHGT